MNIRIYKHNNYYNRIVKRYETLEEYGTPLEELFNVTNWNPNDGISTEQIINYFGDMPDYLIAFENDGTINSRWFIMECRRERSQQFRMYLYRDVIADWYDEVIAAPCFIEKATLDINDPAIYNREEMTYNQIKSGEYLISDESGVPWVVVYMAKKPEGTEADPIPIPQSFTVPAYAITPDYTYASLEEYPYPNGFIGAYNSNSFTISMDLQFSTTNLVYRFSWDEHGNFLGSSHITGSGAPWENVDVPRAKEIISTLVADQDWGEMSEDYISASTAQIEESFLSEKGKIVRAGDLYYKVVIDYRDTFSETKSVSAASELGIKIAKIAAAIGGVTVNDNMIKISYSAPRYYRLFEHVDPDEATLPIPSTRTRTVDSSYDIIMIPAGDYNLLAGGVSVDCSGELAMRFAAEIGQQPDTIVYDVQLLPYGALPEGVAMRPKEFSFDGTTDAVDGIDYSFITTEDDKKVGLVLFLSSKDIYKRVYHDFTKLRKAGTALEKKVNNETTLVRLVSPNYDGRFEYNIEKIGDSRYYNIYCTYKPYQPYICVAPDFNGSLYGANYGDSRGLVCGGDFSLPRTIDQWLTYQLNNKNYQKIFDRQIQNMEVNNRAARIQDIAGALSGTATGAASGALAGSVAGLPGAIAGGIVGGVVSAGGGIADVVINERLRQEAIDYAKDQFGYNLGNIRALPDVLTKIGAFDITNKVFPFVEFYKSTETERQALRDKIRYNGMTVMRIGRIVDFQKQDKTYIKGKLIRLENVYDDYHVVNTIATELNKGVFI